MQELVGESREGRGPATRGPPVRQRDAVAGANVAGQPAADEANDLSAWRSYRCCWGGSRARAASTLQCACPAPSVTARSPHVTQWMLLDVGEQRVHLRFHAVQRRQHGGIAAP